MTYLWWYIVPLSLGMTVTVVGGQLQRSKSLASIALALLIIVSVGAILNVLQRSFALKTKQRIDQLAVISQKSSEFD
jgi:hypothetical protein